jgi:putative ABC transport system permease protein
VFGLAPALTASKPDLVNALKNSRSFGLMSFGLRSLRGWLVVVELALAVVLMLGAGLLVRSFNKLMAVDLGFDRENVLTFRVSLPRSKYPKPAQTAAFHKDLMQRLNALPGMQTAGMINHSPLAGHGLIAFIGIEGQPPLDRKKDPPIGIGVVDDEYFKTLKIPLLSGRQYDARDGADGQKVAIVNQAFVKRFLPGGDALGKRVTFGCEESEGFCRTIVGVVGNIRQESITDEAIPEMYLPFAQMPLNGTTVMVRTSADPLVLVGAVRNEVLAIDKDQPISDVKTLAQRVGEVVAVSRSLMLLFTAFALLALILGAVGIYGIVSYSVTQRTHEIGIRMALGARATDVLKLIMGNGIAMALIGIAMGVGGALAVTRFLKAMLFGVTPTDMLTFLAVSSLLFVVTLFASLIPARRATKVDPLVALRYE